MKKWEYRVKRQPFDSLEAFLNKEGDNGWELVTVTGVTGNYFDGVCVLIFKREINTNKSSKLISQKETKVLDTYDVYKSYKHGNSVTEVLCDYDLSLTKFKKIMHLVGGSGFHPMLFSEDNDGYNALEKCTDAQIQKMKDYSRRRKECYGCGSKLKTNTCNNTECLG